jgi:hypothetical protein
METVMLSNNTYINTITELSIQSRGQNKYLNWYLSIIKKAQNRNLTEYTEKHHIVPDCFYITRKRKGPTGFLSGTGENKNNFAQLTPEEHRTTHLLLVKMFDCSFILYNSLLCSAILMSTDIHGNRLTNKTYGWIKKKKSISQSIRMSGKNNPMYNKLGNNNPNFRKPSKRKGIAHKQSSKDLMSKSKKGKKRTIPHSENQIELLIARCQKQYKIYSPNNEILIITNMTKFCKENNLDPGNMFKVANGFKQNYKGWVCEHYIS